MSDNIYQYVEKFFELLPKILTLGYEFLKKSNHINIFESRDNAEICSLLSSNSLQFEGIAVGAFGAVGKLKTTNGNYNINVAHWNESEKNLKWESVNVVMKRMIQDSFSKAKIYIDELRPSSHDMYKVLNPAIVSMYIDEPLSELFFGGVASHLYSCGVNPFNIRYFSAFHCPKMPVGDSNLLIEQATSNMWTLMSRTKDKEYISLNDWKCILVQYLVAIYLNKKCLNLLHYDLHPGNVMVIKNPNIYFKNNIVDTKTVFSITSKHCNILIPIETYLVKIIDFGLCHMFGGEGNPLFNLPYATTASNLKSINSIDFQDFLTVEFHYFLINIFGFLYDKKDLLLKPDIDTTISLAPYYKEVAILYELIFSVSIYESYKKEENNTLNQVGIICTNRRGPKNPNIQTVDDILEVAAEYCKKTRTDFIFPKRNTTNVNYMEYVSPYTFYQQNKNFVNLSAADFNDTHSSLIKYAYSTRDNILCEKFGACSFTIPPKSFYSKSNINHNQLTIDKSYKTTVYKRVTVSNSEYTYNVFFITNQNNARLIYKKNHLLRIPVERFGILISEDKSIVDLKNNMLQGCVIFNKGKTMIYPTDKFLQYITNPIKFACELGINYKNFTVKTQYFYKFLIWDKNNIIIIEFDCKMNLNDCIDIIKTIPRVSSIFVIPGEERICTYENEKEMYTSSRQIVNKNALYLYF